MLVMCSVDLDHSLHTHTHNACTHTYIHTHITVTMTRILSSQGFTIYGTTPNLMPYQNNTHWYSDHIPVL